MPRANRMERLSVAASRALAEIIDIATSRAIAEINDKRYNRALRPNGADHETQTSEETQPSQERETFPPDGGKDALAECSGKADARRHQAVIPQLS